MPSISVRSLYQDNQHKLQLAWAAGAADSRAADNRIRGRDMVFFLFFGYGEQFFQTACVVEGRPRLYPFGA